MNLRFSIRDLLWLTLVVATFLGWWVFSQRTPAAPTWEYRDFRIAAGSGWAFAGQHINHLGDDGWEVCGVANGEEGAIVLLKRPKR